MQVFIDADGCPVTNIALEICKKQGVACTLVCDTAHEFYREGARTLVVDKGADSADFAEEKIREAGITRSFYNDDLKHCMSEIIAYIQSEEI